MKPPKVLPDTMSYQGGRYELSRLQGMDRDTMVRVHSDVILSPRWEDLKLSEDYPHFDLDVHLRMATEADRKRWERYRIVPPATSDGVQITYSRAVDADPVCLPIDIRGTDQVVCYGDRFFFIWDDGFEDEHLPEVMADRVFHYHFRHPDCQRSWGRKKTPAELALSSSLRVSGYYDLRQDLLRH